MAGNFSEGLSWVVSGGKYAFIATDGAILSRRLRTALRTRAARVDKDGKRGLINPTGEVLVPAKYQEILSAGEGRFRAEIQIGDQSLWGYVDADGTVLCEPTFTYAGPFDNGVAKVQHDSHWGLIDSYGKSLTDGWDGMTNFFADRAWVQKANLWGSIDRTGKIIVPPTYSQVRRFHDGFARVRAGNGYRYIDPAGTLANDTWDAVGNFDGGYARISRNKKWAIIDASGTVVGSWTDFTPWLPPDAVQLARDDLEALKGLYGGTSAETATGLHNLAVALDNKGETAEVQTDYRQALNLRKHILWYINPDTLNTEERLAFLLKETRQTRGGRGPVCRHCCGAARHRRPGRHASRECAEEPRDLLRRGPTICEGGTASARGLESPTAGTG